MKTIWNIAMQVVKGIPHYTHVTPQDALALYRFVVAIQSASCHL